MPEGLSEALRHLDEHGRLAEVIVASASRAQHRSIGGMLALALPPMGYRIQGAESWISPQDGKLLVRLFESFSDVIAFGSYSATLIVTDVGPDLRVYLRPLLHSAAGVPCRIVRCTKAP